MSYTIEDIARIIGARRIGDTPAAIDWLLTDSRSLSFPEETLFFALTTKRNDGARYIRDLYTRGVRNFVVSEEGLKEVETFNFQPSTFNLLVVPSPLKALQKLAEQHRDRFQIPVIGITGSNGKNHCEGVVASVVESGACNHPFAPQLQFADWSAFVRMADEWANGACHIGGRAFRNREKCVPCRILSNLQSVS